jgi:hypothetical protein
LKLQSNCILSNPRIFKDKAIQERLLYTEKFESMKRLNLFKPQRFLAIQLVLFEVVTLHDDFVLSHSAFILSRIVIASTNRYRSEPIGPVIASYIYRYD